MSPAGPRDTADVAGDVAKDVEWMRVALAEAAAAAAAGEVPVGAVLVIEGRAAASGRNRTITDSDPSGHAEIVTLRRAAEAGGDFRCGGTLYVTLEPCLMCMGAMVQARVERLVFGARDPKAGAAVSLYRIAEDRRLNHRFEVSEGVLAEQAGALLTKFFAERRAEKGEGRRRGGPGTSDPASD